MSNIRQIAFSIITSIILASVLVALITTAPFKDGTPERSYLEGRNYKTIENVLSKPIWNGKLQGQFENYVADHVPFRDTAILANAAWQRQEITLANVAFGYEMYPTFLGSDHVVVPSRHAIVETAEHINHENDKSRKAWIKTLNKCAKKYPNVRFACAQVTENRQCSANPTSSLIGEGKHDERWVQAHVIDKLDPRLHAFVDYAVSSDELDKSWFKTDVHWKLDRALETYNRIANILDLKIASFDGAIKVSDAWYGNFTRHGLCLDYSDELWDVPKTFDNLHFHKLKEPRKEFAPGRRDAILAGRDTLDSVSPFDGYVEYFGGGGMIAENAGANNGRTCLTIGDSFCHCLKRYIADNYERTVFLLPGNDKVKDSFSKCIEKYRPDDVIILTHAEKYAQMEKESPKFLGMKKK